MKRFIKNLVRIIKKIRDWDKPDKPDKPDIDSPNQDDQVPYHLLHYTMGGFKGNGVPIGNSRIADLAVNKRGNVMSYKWLNGGCNEFGAKNVMDANYAYACLFFKGADGQWVGGKFDWISTNRLTRDFNNIQSGYVGWNAQGFNSATEFCFCIVGVDGKARTNTIYYKEP